MMTLSFHLEFISCLRHGREQQQWRNGCGGCGRNGSDVDARQRRNKPSAVLLNNGTTWTATTGLATRVAATADKVKPANFYAFDGSAGSSGGFYSTTNSNGQVFTKVNTTALPVTTSCSGSGCGRAVSNWAKAGDLWLPLGNNGLFHSVDGGVTWMRSAAVASAYSVAVGASAPGSAVQSIFLYGVASPLGVSAIYRSDNNGASWLRINDDLHQYGGPTLIQADPRVYLGMNGRGIICGDIAQ